MQLFYQPGKITLLGMDINDNLEAMAQALYDYWFVQFDFPDENGKPYKSSGGKMVWNEVLRREIPEGWSCGQLGDIIQANPTEHLNKGAVAPYIAMEALSTTRFLTDEPEKKAYAGGMKFRNKDILIARITPCLENGKTALVHDLKDKEVGFGSTEYIVIRGKLFSLPTFCICLARSKEFRTYAISKMTGTSGRRRLDYKDVEAYKQPIPPASLLCRFENWGAGVLDKMHKTLVQNRILEKQRDFLLPLLMNGQAEVRPQGELNYHFLRRCLQLTLPRYSIFPSSRRSAHPAAAFLCCVDRPFFGIFRQASQMTARVYSISNAM